MSKALAFGRRFDLQDVLYSILRADVEKDDEESIDPYETAIKMLNKYFS